MNSTLKNQPQANTQTHTEGPLILEEVPDLTQKVSEIPPQIVITMDVQIPPQPSEKKEHQSKSIYGEQDMISVIQDKTDWDKEASEGGNRNKVVRKCFNQKCEITKNLRKVKSRVVPSKYRNFCQNCHKNYVNNQFCQFCQQIYGDNTLNQEDDNNWIGCDECQRWNHVSCQFEKRNKNAYAIKQASSHYLCVECAKKKSAKNQNRKQKTTLTEEDCYHSKYQKNPEKKKMARQNHKQEKYQKIGNSNPSSVNIFDKPREINLYLDAFLHSMNNYRLCISDQQIKEDLRKIRDIYAKDKGMQGR